jgi:hypothetical protein
MRASSLALLRCVSSHTRLQIRRTEQQRVKRIEEEFEKKKQMEEFEVRARGRKGYTAGWGGQA